MMKKPRLRNILLILLGISFCWVLVCARAGGVISVPVILRRLSPYLLAFAVFGIALSSGRHLTHTISFIALCCYALVECGLGTAQLAGWADSRHSFYHLTGNFLNPAPYACFLGIASICCIVRLIRNEGCRYEKILTGVTLLWSLAMVVIARSRAVWLGMALALIVALTLETEVWKQVRHRSLVACCVAAVSIAGCIGAWMLKPESAEVRFYTWQTDCLVIAEHPLTGVGPGAEMGAFADAQSEYFSRHVRCWRRQAAADTPQYPFNEFLRMGMACGIPGLLLAVAVFAVALVLELRRRRLWAYSLIVLGVFGTFSYPLSQMALSLLLVFALADAVTLEEKPGGPSKAALAAALLLAAASVPFVRNEVRHRTEMAAFMKDHQDEVTDSDELAAYYDELNDEPAYLTLYAKSLYDEGRYKAALPVVGRLEKLKADAAVPVMRGEILKVTGDPSGAAQAYIKSYQTAPSRLTALLFLMRLYDLYGLDEAALETGDFALSIPVDEKYTATMEVRRQIEDFLLAID